jgi:transposase
MLGLSGKARIFLHHTPVDMRKGFEGLSAIVEVVFTGELLSGAYFVFLNKPKNRMKVLYWDSDGLALWYKRLEKGSFRKPNNSQLLMDRRAFFMLLEGITPQHMQKRYKVG